MVPAMKFEDLVEHYGRYLAKGGTGAVDVARTRRGAVAQRRLPTVIAVTVGERRLVESMETTGMR